MTFLFMFLKQSQNYTWKIYQHIFKYHHKISFWRHFLKIKRMVVMGWVGNIGKHIIINSNDANEYLRTKKWITNTWNSWNSGILENVEILKTWNSWNLDPTSSPVSFLIMCTIQAEAPPEAILWNGEGGDEVAFRFPSRMIIFCQNEIWDNLKNEMMWSP